MHPLADVSVISPILKLAGLRLAVNTTIRGTKKTASHNPVTARATLKQTLICVKCLIVFLTMIMHLTQTAVKGIFNSVEVAYEPENGL